MESFRIYMVVVVVVGTGDGEAKKAKKAFKATLDSGGSS